MALCGAGEPRGRHGRQIAGQEDGDLHSLCPARVQGGVGRADGTSKGAVRSHGLGPEEGWLILPIQWSALFEGPGGIRPAGNGLAKAWRAAC